MKVLIFMREGELKPAGGPPGYCYNIRNELIRRGETSVEFLPSEDATILTRKSKYRAFMNKMPKFINATQIALRRKHNYKRMLKHPQKHSIDFSQYDAVHFHTTGSLFAHRKDLENYQGKVILTTHTPVPTHQEIYEELPTKTEKKLFRKFYMSLASIDKYAYERADYIVYPCEEAEESYLKNWSEYKNVRQEMQSLNKLFYIPTGIEPKIVTTDREVVRSRHGIASDDFVVSYVGRHNSVKGYDSLQTIAKLCWDNGKKYRFLIAGKEAPLTGIEDPKWTEVGWTNEPQAVIAASDVFVLPNRETYFDIVMLEVMSLGKIIIASRTGGNKYFERIGAEGIMLYDTVEEAQDLLNNVNNMTVEERNALGAKNLELFNSKFRTSNFVDTYLEFLNDITNKN